jgi:hypothetical protein
MWRNTSKDFTIFFHIITALWWTLSKISLFFTTIRNAKTYISRHSPFWALISAGNFGGWTYVTFEEMKVELTESSSGGWDASCQCSVSSDFGEFHVVAVPICNTIETCLFAYVTTLSVSRTCSVETVRWITNWKWFWRKQSQFNRGNIEIFSCRTWGNP